VGSIRKNRNENQSEIEKKERLAKFAEYMSLNRDNESELEKNYV
jgi:hypothetical protein